MQPGTSDQDAAASRRDRAVHRRGGRGDRRRVRPRVRAAHDLRERRQRFARKSGRPLRRGDVDRDLGVVRVERTVVDGEEKPYGKTTRSRRSVPLSSRALGGDRGAPCPAPSPAAVPSPARRPHQPQQLATARVGSGPVRGRRRVPAALLPTAHGDQPMARGRCSDLRREQVRGHEPALMIQKDVNGHLVPSSVESARARIDAFRAYKFDRLGVEQASSVGVDTGPSESRKPRFSRGFWERERRDSNPRPPA